MTEPTGSEYEIPADDGTRWIWWPGPPGVWTGWMPGEDGVWLRTVDQMEQQYPEVLAREAGGGSPS